jgi:hypothetical protein
VRSTLVALGGIGVGFLVVLTLLRPHPGGVTASPSRPTRAAPALARAPEAPPRPPDEARSSELFRRNAGMPADPDLASEYETLNLEYFSNILPAPQVRWESGLADLGPLIADTFTVQGLTDGRMILVNPSVERDADQRRRALCHEMVHMAVWAQDTGHGVIFQDRLRQLSLRGAFKGIVATDEEKDATLAELRTRRGALEAEDQALTADRASLDRTSEAQVDGYNARVQAQQHAAAEYNRLIERYNLMVSYPDGLARERLARRADGTSR